VNHVNLTVRRGEVHGLVGESGSGKTQTAFSILRLLPQGGRITGGSIVFEGKDLAQLSEKERHR
jgi:peptide/nickel transport system permease protein